MAKFFPWTRAIVLILSMLLTQTPLARVSAAPKPVEVAAPVGDAVPDVEDSVTRLAAAPAPGDVAGIPLRQDDPGLEQECKIKVMAVAVEAFPGEPDPLQPPDSDVGDANPAFGATVITNLDTQVDELLIWVVVMNWTGKGDPECPTEEPIQMTSVSVTVNGQAPLEYRGNGLPDFPTTLAGAEDYIQGQYVLPIDASTPGTLHIHLDADGLDSTSGNGNLVRDVDNWYVTLATPGIEVLSFVPSETEANPGDRVNFTLRVRNQRPGVNITDLRFLSDLSQYQTQCNDLSDWTVTGTGTDELVFETGETAECIITNVQMPADSPNGEFQLVGDLTAFAEGVEAVLEDVTSVPPVALYQASIDVQKEVDRIMRGTQEVQPPAQPGDQIHYFITVTNTSLGNISLDNIVVQDSLTGRVPGTAGITLGPGEDETFPAVWTVLPNSQDPLTNIASASARVVTTGRSVSDDGAISVDIADSALRMELTADPPTADPGMPVTFHMTLYNDGDKPITNLTYPPLSGGLTTVGTPPPLPLTLPLGPTTRSWTYTVQPTDLDPLINTVRVTGMVDGAALSAQAQAVVDVTNPFVGITAIVIEPATTTVLRGGEAVYAIEVENKGSSPICNVTVAQYRVDADTGNETLIIPSLPLSGLTGGQLEGLSTANTSSTYLVTASEKDPLHMVFAVGATPCAGGDPLSDRTSRVLEISDVQVNAVIQASVANNPVTSAEVGSTVQFEYLVTNVGTITLSNVSATYCFPSLVDCSDPTKHVLITPDPLDNGALLNFETASVTFTRIMEQTDADAGRFPVEVTLSATDNRGRDVRLKTTGEIDVTSQNFALEVTGPLEAVSGDKHTFSYTLTNRTGVEVTGITLTVQDGSNTVVGSGITIPLGTTEQPATVQGTFEHKIDAPPGVPVFTLELRANGTAGANNVVATGTHDIVLLPLITVDKTGPDSTTPNQDVTYIVTIKNNSVSQTFVTDSLTDDVFAKYNEPVGLDDFDWPGTPGTLGPGEIASATLVLPSVQADVTPLVNTFTVTGTSADKPVAPAIDQHSMEVTCPVDFQAVVTGLPVLGQTLHWEITAYNTTDVELTNLQVTESLHWGGPVPSLPSSIPAHGSVTFQPFDKPVTNDYFNANTEEAYMTSNLTATFGAVAGVASCVEKIEWPLFSPVTVIKVPDTSLALTGDTVNYTFTLLNVSPNDSYYVTLHDPLLSPDPIPMYYNGDTQPATESGWMEPGEAVTGEPRAYIVKASDPDELVNTATAQFPDPKDANTIFYTTGQATVLTVEPLTLVKEPSASTAVRGTEIAYTYELTNNTNYEITDITLTDDRIPHSLIPGTYLEPLGQPVTLAPFETKAILNVPYLIPVDAPSPVINTATATGIIHLPAETRPVTAEATISVQLELPKIKIEKEIRDATTKDRLLDELPANVEGGDGMVEGEAGQQVQYCFTVTNEDPAEDTFVSGIVVEDAKLGAGVLQPLFLSAVNALPTHTDRPAADMLYGTESVSFCYPGDNEEPLALNRAQGDPQTNTVTLRGEVSDGTPVYVEDSVTVDLIGTDLLITKATSQPLAYIGQDVTYTILLENKNLTYAIDNIEVMDSFIGEIDLADDKWDWPAAPGTLQPGEVATYSYVYTVRPQDPDPLINRASATGTLTDPENTPVEDATQSALAITPSQLLVRKYPSITRALPEQEVRYTIAITNVGQVLVSNLTATDTQMNPLPAPSVTELWPNKTAYITYTLAMPTEAELAADPTLDPFVNTVEVMGDVFGVEEPVVGQATATVDIIQPNVSITKVANEAAAQPGGDVAYTITIRNTGSISSGDTLTDLIFRDLTAGTELDLDSLCPDGPECVFAYGPEPFEDDGSGTFVPNPVNGEKYDSARGLLPGEMLIGTITVTVPSDLAGTEFTNTAEIVASAGEVTARDRNAATIDVRLEGIDVIKTANPPSAVIGQNVEYTISVENTGRVPFTRLVITDPAIPGSPVTVEGGFPDTEGGADTLDPGEVYPYTYTYTVQAADGERYTNDARVRAFTASNASITSFAQETIDIRVAEVSVEKFVCSQDNPTDNTVPTPCTPVVNVADQQQDDVFYYVRISNPGVVRIENITVTDPLAPGGTFDAANWPGGQNALDPGADAWFKYGYTVQDADLDPLRNTVLVTAQSATTPPQTAEDAATATLRLVTSDLQLTKTADRQTARVGDIVRYTLTVTHLGTVDEPITGITIKDALSESTAALCAAIDLDPGESDSTCTLAHPVTQADPAPLINQAFAQGSQVVGEETVPVRDTATHTLEIVTPGLSVTKTPSASIARFGETVTFTYIVKNTGSSQITNLQVTDSDPQITFNQPWPTTLAMGQTAVRTATRTMSVQDPDPYTNTVTVTGERSELAVRAEATATVALSATGGALAVSNVPDRQYVEAGGQVIFAYTARNLGTEPLTALSLSDNGLCADLDGQLASTTLEPRGSVTVYCTVTNASPPGPLVSTVRVTALAGDRDVSDTATARVEVVSGGLLVTKTADRFVAAPGDPITFTITVKNVGTEPLHSLELYESMALTLTPELPDILQPGASLTLSGTVTVPTEAPPDSVANNVSVTAVGANTGNTYQDSASAAVAVQTDPNAILVLTKQATTDAGTLRARPDDAITYTFTARNVSDTAVQGVTLTDTALADMFPTADLGPGETVTWTSQPHQIPADITATTYANTATVTADGHQEPLASASATVPVQLAELTKTAAIEEGKTEAEPGDEVTYTLAVESFTTAELTGITLEDPLLTFDAPLLTTIPPTGATATGRLTIPDPYADAEFVNTATLRMNGEWLDDASATVPVITPELKIEITQISQVDPGTQRRVTGLFQTGEPIEIEFRVTNVSTEPIPLVFVTGSVAFPVSGPAQVNCTAVGTLEPGAQKTESCYFVPETEIDPADLNPELTLTASGGLPGDDPITHEAKATLPLVDLVLGATLEVTPPAAERGEDVTLELTLTNLGASPLGCDIAIRDARPCWEVVFESLPTGWQDQDLLDAFAVELDRLQATELAPGASEVFTSAPLTVPNNALHTPFEVTVTGGSYDSDIAETDLDAYKTQVSAETTLTIEYEGVVMAITAVEQTLGGVLVDGTQNRPLQTGKPVTVRFSVLNDSDTTLNDLEYGIVFGGEQFPCAPAQSGAADVLPIGQSRALSCQFTPPVADEDYLSVGLVQSIQVTLNATGDAGQIIPGTSAQVDSDVESTVPTTNITEVYLIDLKLSVTVNLSKNGLPVGPQTPALPGETILIRATLRNEGASPLGCPPTILDPACALKLESVNVPLPVDSLSQVNTQLQAIQLQPGQPATVTIPWTVPQGTTETQVIVAASTGTWSQDIASSFGLYSAYASGAADLTLGVPKLTVSINAWPLPPVTGQNITYTVTVRNDGLIPVTLQSGTYQIIPLTTAHAIDGIMLMSNSARPQGQALSGTLSFTPTALMPGETATATVSKIEDQRGAYRFLVTVTGFGLAQPVQVTSELTLTPLGTGTPTPTVDPATLDPNATEPQVTKDPSAPNVQPGGTVSWTVKVRNGSTGVMAGVVVSDSVPPTMTVTAAASDRGPATVNGPLVSLSIGTLNPGETVTLTINTALSPAVGSPATVTNTACAARQGGPQVCDVGTVTVGPGVSGLPATGIRSQGGALGWRWDALFGVALSGALMLFLSIHASQQRMLIAIVFLLVALVAIGGAVALVLTRDGGEDQPDDQAQVPARPTQGQGESAAPGEPPSADGPGSEPSGDPADTVMPTPYRAPAASGTRTLLIPKLSEEFPAPIPILEVPIINRQWDVSGLGYYVGWLDGTTWLESDWGNTVLAAHVQLDAQTPGPFWGLSELVPGDEIIVREGDTERVYVVMSTRKVDPDDWTVTAPTDGPTLTLITCTDWNNAYGVFAQRLVVQAIPVA